MRIALEIPKVGLVMESARLVRWLKNVGDTVKQGEPIVELETEKSLVEIESAHDGRLAELLLGVDEQANVGDRIAWLESDSPTASVPSAAATRTMPTAPPRSAPPASAPGPAVDVAGGRTVSTPVARRLARQQAIDLSQVAGTGPKGRVQLADVQRAISATTSGTAAQPLSSMRRAVARSMTLSNASVPQFTMERSFDCTALLRCRARLSTANAPAPIALSVNDFLLQAAARALIEHPALNATFSGDAGASDAHLLRASGAHIGIVVAVADGLLVPVLHRVDRYALVEIARQRADLVDRALHGRLRQDELEGATISISNLGTRGPDRFTALVDPPQSAILAVGRQQDRVVVIEGAMQVRPIVNLTLTVDHRVTDGRVAAEFLNALVGHLEVIP